MITRNTVLVLGAGASAPYAFPTGRTLLLKICQDLGSTSPLHEALLALGHSEGDVQEFRAALDLSKQPSVDLFVERRPEFEPIGKVAIAAALIPYENEANLARGVTESWYEYLWKKLSGRRAGDFASNQLTVLTFNYDRSLEHFLYLALRHSHNLRDPQVAKLLRAGAPVIHLYGQLGDLPCLGPSDRARSYKPEYDVATLEEWANAIKIFTEDVPPEDPNFKNAWASLSRAEVVCFLGFGYHEANVERLRVKELLKEAGRARPRPEIYGSAYGIGPGERPAKERLFPHLILLGDDHLKVLDVLRRWPILG